VEKKMKVTMKMKKTKWSKLFLFCLSTLLVTNAYCKSTDALPPKMAGKTTQQTNSVLKKTQPTLEKTVAKQTRAERIKTMVEENDNKAKMIQTEMNNAHHKKRIMKTNCNIAKNRLQDLMTTPRIKVKQDNGSIHYMTQTEKAQKMKKTRQAIKQYCGHQ